jgi:molecular chaperone GrpE
MMFRTLFRLQSRNAAAMSEQRMQSSCTRRRWMSATADDDNKQSDDEAENVAKKSDDEIDEQEPAEAEQQQEAEELSVEDQLRKEVAEFKDQLLRSYAERENMRKIAANDVENAKRFAVSKMAKDLLDVADNLERALDNVPQEKCENDADLKSLHEGVSLTRNVLLGTFKRFKIERFDPLGQQFDPNFHSALFQMPAPDKEPNSVATVVKVGYMIEDRVLRPADVGVVAESK